jgi:hypothetical protein
VKRRPLLIIPVVALVLAGCQFAVTPDGPADSFTESNGTVTVSAPTMGDGNNREFFWASGGPLDTDTTACATFSGGQGEDQPGIAMRIADLGEQAVTVTQNIYGYDRQVFNFHTWNTANGPDDTFSLFGQTTLPAFPISGTWPFSMCARITGTTVQFVVWTSGMTQPDWGDPTWGGQADLPASAPTVGQSGFYVGHLLAGTSMDYSGLTVDGQPSDPLR